MILVAVFFAVIHVQDKKRGSVGQGHKKSVRIDENESIYVLAETFNLEEESSGDATARQLWPASRRAAQIIGRALRGLPRRRVLEIACGLGAPSMAAARCGHSVLAVDYDELALEYLQEAARDQALDIDTLQCDLCDMETALPSADILILADAAADQRLVNAVARRSAEALLRGGGIVCFAAMQTDRAQRLPLWTALESYAFDDVHYLDSDTSLSYTSTLLRDIIVEQASTKDRRTSLLLLDVNEDDPSLYL